jgi:hypothetical protein
VLALAGLSIALGVGCPNKPSGGGQESAPSGSTSASPAPATPPSASASATAATTTWTGTYASTPGTLFVHDGGEWKGVHFRGDDASVGLGEGPFSLTVDTKTSRVTGSGSGALGDFVVTGAQSGDLVTISVLRKDASDRGLTGTGVGTLAGNELTGTLRLSQGNAHVIRQAAFHLSKQTH